MNNVRILHLCFLFLGITLLSACKKKKENQTICDQGCREIKGKIFSDNGDPVVGARVFLKKRGGIIPTGVYSRLSTNNHGDYKFRFDKWEHDFIGGRSVQVLVYAKNHMFDYKRIYQAFEDTIVDFKLSPAAYVKVIIEKNINAHSYEFTRWKTSEDYINFGDTEINNSYSELIHTIPANEDVQFRFRKERTISTDSTINVNTGDTILIVK